MHQNVPFFMKKTANNGHFLVKSWDFWALPYFEGAGCEKADCRDTQITQTQFTASVRTKICHFHENRPKMALFLSNIDFLALYKQLKDPPPLF